MNKKRAKMAINRFARTRNIYRWIKKKNNKNNNKIKNKNKNWRQNY